MINLHPIRQRAWEAHRRLRPELSPWDLSLLPAEALLERASAATGLLRYPLPPDDGLLAGARAVLLADHECIYYAQPDSDRTARLQRFSQAHEFAHHWLHNTEQDKFDTDEEQLALLLMPSLPQVQQVAQGYSPAERRESEANAFAAEFLLPGPLLRAAFTEHGLSASEIADLAGVSEACVLTQLSLALLSPSTMETPAPSLPSSVEPAVPDRVRESRAQSGVAATLDPDQATAALLDHGPALTDAGPGTGKTRTLVARAVHLLEERGLPPERLLALTFSNKAAEEMRVRLQESVGARADQVWIGTFHAFGFEILRKDGQRLGLPNTPNLLQTSDAVELLVTHLDQLGLQELEYLSDPTLPFPDILRCISRAKDECITPESYFALAQAQFETAANDEERLRAVKSREVAGVYAVYERLKREQGLLDFGDLLMRAVELLDREPEVRERWQQQFAHVLADEYQDVNRACAFLLQRLVGTGEGFWAVGDLRQAIYRFRGASPANVQQFDHDFPGGQRLRLGVNYRSYAPIVSLFSGFAAAMSQQNAETMSQQDAEALAPAERQLSWEPRRGGADLPALTLAEAQDEEAQADGIGAQILNFQEGGIALQDQAILVCTNAQATDMAERLERRGIPTQHLGSLFDRAEVKDMLALVALVAEPEGTTLPRVARFPEYEVPQEDVALLLAEARERGKPFPEALGLAADLPSLSESGRAGLTRLWQQIGPITRRGDAWSLLTRYLFERSAYLRPLLAAQTVASRQQLLALSQLLTFAQGLTQRLQPQENETKTQLFLRHLRRLILCGEERSARTPGGVEDLPAVRLMTVHQSKGLEFPVVYLPNLNKGQFPARGSGGMVAPPPALLGEEAEAARADGADCLFFVALSRAKDHLVLSRPLERNGTQTRPSPLLERLEPALTACDAARISWTRAQAAGEPIPDLPELAPPPDLSLWQVDNYRDCPRRFYYQQVARLPSADDASPYLQFHGSLKETIQWLQQERAAGRDPLPDEARERLSAVWEQKFTGAETAQGRLLRSHAEKMLGNAFQNLTPPRSEPPTLRLVATLEHGRVDVPCDAAETQPDGSLRVTRHFRRRLKKDDHTDERLALTRYAATQSDPDRPVTLELRSLVDGETREVKPSLRYEPARVEKYNAALHGIRAGYFPPEPEERKCALCPFFFLCPA
jgi:DNA helicase-2/ATP-dependent DNA helicase PcrA